MDIPRSTSLTSSLPLRRRIPITVSAELIPFSLALIAYSMAFTESCSVPIPLRYMMARNSMAIPPYLSAVSWTLRNSSLESARGSENL